MASSFEFCFADHERFYPPIIARVEVQKYFPWLTAKRLANLDSLGKGPESFKNGRAVVYPVKPFLAWLDERTAEYSGKKRVNQNLKKVNYSSGYPGIKNKKGRKTKYQEVMERRRMA